MKKWEGLRIEEKEIDKFFVEWMKKGEKREIGKGKRMLMGEGEELMKDEEEKVIGINDNDEDNVIGLIDRRDEIIGIGIKRWGIDGLEIKEESIEKFGKVGIMEEKEDGEENGGLKRKDMIGWDGDNIERGGGKSEEMG